MSADAPRTLRSGFLDSFARDPERIALEVDGERWSYGRLARRAAALAAALRAHDAGPGPKLTAVFAQRSATAFSGLLAALFRGHGYVPLNPAFPRERTVAMLERARCRSIVVDDSAAAQLDEILPRAPEGLLWLLPDRDDVSDLAKGWPGQRFLGRSELEAEGPPELDPVSPDDPAYLLFTSGSTGLPKGVMVAHRNVTPFIESMVERYQIGPHDRLSQMFDMTFDLSVFDMFVAWERGACVCCPTSRQKLLPRDYIESSGITVWFSVPSTAALLQRLRLLRPGRYPKLRLALFCGEALSVDLAEAFAAAAPQAILENLYGPTELTIACTLYRWRGQSSLDEAEAGVVPIGAPYPGMEALVVDEMLRAVAPGEAGELLVTGPQMTPGYWRDAEQTAQAFVQPPGEQRVFYRTGDRVRLARPEGPLVYLGRVDHQIKVQGYRVELGEIERVLREAGGGPLVVALGWPAGGTAADTTVAVVSDPRVELNILRAACQARLPAYMVPRAIHVMPDPPLNANGKVDRRALAERLEEKPDPAA